MNLQPTSENPASIQPFAGPFTPRPPLAIRDVVLRHLRTPPEIAEVLHLRDEIDLSVHAAAGPLFAALEKKETSAVSSLPSSWTVS